MIQSINRLISTKLAVSTHKKQISKSLTGKIKTFELTTISEHCFIQNAGIKHKCKMFKRLGSPLKKVFFFMQKVFRSFCGLRFHVFDQYYFE